MNNYLIAWGVNNHTSYDDACKTSAKNHDDAMEEAFNNGVEEVDNYGGLHGFPTSGEQTCENCSGDDEDCYDCGGEGHFTIAWDDFVDQASSWVSHTAFEYGKQDKEIIEFLETYFTDREDLYPKT